MCRISICELTTRRYKTSVSSKLYKHMTNMKRDNETGESKMIKEKFSWFRLLILGIFVITGFITAILSFKFMWMR